MMMHQLGTERTQQYVVYTAPPRHMQAHLPPTLSRLGHKSQQHN